MTVGSTDATYKLLALLDTGNKKIICDQYTVSVRANRLLLHCFGMLTVVTIFPQYSGFLNTAHIMGFHTCGIPGDSEGMLPCTLSYVFCVLNPGLVLCSHVRPAFPDWIRSCLARTLGRREGKRLPSQALVPDSDGMRVSSECSLKRVPFFSFCFLWSLGRRKTRLACRCPSADSTRSMKFAASTT